MGRVILGALAALLLAAPSAQALDVARITVNSPPAGVDCTTILTVNFDVNSVFLPDGDTVRGDETECITPLGVCTDDYKPYFEDPNDPSYIDYSSSRGCDLSFEEVAVDCQEDREDSLAGYGEWHSHCYISRGGTALGCAQDRSYGGYFGTSSSRSRTCTATVGDVLGLSCTDEEAAGRFGTYYSAGECTVTAPDGSSRTWCTNPAFVPTVVTGYSIPVPTQLSTPPPEGCLR